MDDFFIDDGPRKRKRPETMKQKGKRNNGDDISDDDLDMDGSVLGDRSDGEEPASDNEIKETAAQKRLRLAKRYLDKVKEEIEDDGEVDAAKIDEDLIASRLRYDVLESTGKHFRQIAAAYKDLNPQNLPFLVLHNGNKKKGHQLSVTALAFASPSRLSASSLLTSEDTNITDAYMTGESVKESKETVQNLSNDSDEELFYLFSGSKDGSIVKWNLRTGHRVHFVPGGLKNTKKLRAMVGEKALKRQLGHTDHIFSMDVSSDSKYLATGGKDNLIYIWNVLDNKRIGSFKQHRDAISGLAFRKGSNQLYSGSYDRTVKLWNVDEMSYIETLFGHQDQITSIDTLTKERCITTGARDRTVRLWKILEESQLVFRGGGSGGSTSIMEEFANPEDEVKIKRSAIATCVDVVAMLDEENWVSGSDAGYVIMRAIEEFFTYSLFSTISLWNIAKKKAVFTKVNAHSVSDEQSESTCRWVTSLAAVPFSDMFASGACDGSVKLWKLSDTKKSFSPLFQIPVVGFINALRFFELPELLSNTNIPCEIERSGKDQKSPYLYLAIGVGQEHRMGRWWRVKEAKNEVKVVVLG
ncbi:pre-rRNA processing protein [Nowakowskiella sp. JEL0407]|nr:pre-rRNA processing protein [Nowakowskiella sp. JEL0407]